MNLAAIVLIGTGTVLVWSAVTGENPIAATRDVLTGERDVSGRDPVEVPTGDARAEAIDEFAPLREFRRGGALVPSAVPRG